MVLLFCRTYCPDRPGSCSQRPDVMIKLRLGLMKLLEMKLFNLPTEHVPAVIGEVLKAEYMLVWAYHDSDDVRELAIKVLYSEQVLLWLCWGCGRLKSSSDHWLDFSSLFLSSTTLSFVNSQLGSVAGCVASANHWLRDIAPNTFVC